MSAPLLDLQARELLARFGAGEPTPGSGSAAALMGLLSANLVKTVIALSIGKDGYREQRELVAADSDRLQSIVEELSAAFESDSALWAEVVRLRKQRDGLRRAGNLAAARQAGESALKCQREATELPLRMAELCLELAAMATLVFDYGYPSVRGDSVVALDASVSAATGLLGIAYLNLKDFKPGQWSIVTLDMADLLRSKIDSVRVDAVARLNRLRNEATVALGSTLPIEIRA